MKKFFLAIAMVAMLGFVAVPANALIGVPDDVPGTDLLIPWFYVSMPGFGTENTLMTVTEVKQLRPVAPPWPAFPFSTQVLGWVQTIDSETIFDFAFNLTRWDVWSGDALTLINLMSPLGRAALEIDTDGDGINDHWAGYIYLFNNTWPNIDFFGNARYNNLISNCYQVYLTAGMAASFNGVSLEWGDPFNAGPTLTALMADPLYQGNLGTAWSGVFGDEVFSANALWTGKWLLGTGLIAPAPATFMRLLPRYFVLDAIGESLLMIWTEQFYSWAGWPFPLPLVAPIPLPGDLHCSFYNEDEFALSANIPINHELSIVRITDILPFGLRGAFPWAGWINIQSPDIFGAAWNTDFNLNGIPDGAERQWLVYSWQRAVGPAAEAWEVIHKAHRETNDLL